MQQKTTANEIAPRISTSRGLLVLGIGLTLWFLPAPNGLSPEAMHLVAIFVATIVGLIVQPLPQGAVVLMGVTATALTGTLPVREALTGFADPTVWLIVIAFLFARGFIKTGLGRRIAYLAVSRIGKSTLGLGYALTLADLAIAPATPSNTARAGGILFPIVRSLASCLGSEPGPTARRAGAFLIFNQFQINLVTSALFLTGVAPNAMIVRLAQDSFEYSISWVGWFWAALLPAGISLLILPPLIFWQLRPELKETHEAASLARTELGRMGAFGGMEKKMSLIFLITLSLWATSQWSGFSATAVAFLAVSFLLVTGVLSWRDILSESGAWDALVWFGGLVSLAAGLGKLGVIQYLADFLGLHLGEIHSWIPGFILLILAYVYLHYFVASMTAHATAFYVPFGLVAIGIGTPVPLALMVLGFMNSLNAAMTHYGTGPAPIYFGAGYIDQATWWKTGLLISLVTVTIWLSVGALWWKIIGLW